MEKGQQRSGRPQRTKILKAPPRVPHPTPRDPDIRSPESHSLLPPRNPASEADSASPNPPHWAPAHSDSLRWPHAGEQLPRRHISQAGMMNSTGHLPAGQPMQGNADMGIPRMNGGPGGQGHLGQGHGPRRGRPHHNHYNPGAHHHHHHGQYHQPHVAHQPMYAANYMPQPYGVPPGYYAPPAYQNAATMNPYGMPQYAPPAATYARSPPAMQHYMPMVAQNPYARPAPPQSPIVSTPYQAPPMPPPALVPVPAPHTPSSTHSHVVPTPMTPPAQQMPPIVPPQAQIQSQPQVQVQPEPEPEIQQKVVVEEPVAEEAKQPAQAEAVYSHFASPQKSDKPPFSLPWFSHPDTPFPARTKLRRRRQAPSAASESVSLPTAPGQQHEAAPVESAPTENVQEDAAVSTPKGTPKLEILPPRSETPSTQELPSVDTPSTSPTGSIPSQQLQVSESITASPAQPAKQATRVPVPAVPAVPVVPVLPKPAPKDKPATSEEKPSTETKPAGSTPAAEETSETTAKDSTASAPESSAPAAQAAPAPAPVKPKSWANLFTKPAAPVNAAAVAVAAASASQTTVNGNTVADASGAATGVATGFAQSKATSMAEAIQSYRVGTAEKIVFLEPRGLVNTGNMCYMNSILQVLVNCIPFYDFLDQVSKKAVHSFNSETPLLDAMIMFMREFKVIDSAVSIDQLKRRLKSEELEQYGEAFTPEFVYDAIRKLPRFASMRRGHQQDAEEFLGFLLEGLHDECTHVMSTLPVSTTSTAPNSSLPSPTASNTGDDWLEVGPRQKAAITRTSGYSSSISPITRIFGGQLRSELRIPGLKSSVTLEPYQPLQLDIGAPEVRNIVDALRGLTRPETIHGDFNSPHGKDAKATKQVFIESLPPVLILHLKRFQFDAEGHGTIKIWKKVGYPLELEIPREVVSRQKRNTTHAENADLLKYRLITVVYHHGKNASGGHYTVDVRRQDGREWVRIDDTVIRRVRPEDVAEAGAEEKPSKGAVGDRRENGSSAAASNRFGAMNDDDTGDDEGWKQATASGKKWSSVVNGAGLAAPSGSGSLKAAAKQHNDSFKDNKVAYLLFYQRI
ncbi:hypothetical protein NEUTE1DRAFT_119446 [Neurospora tetrasperma FGSC 2508]|uniref:ubiquitinyl hydrolase 1 n=1 Tax=Neurospora tetrasperma (strain FGSC 2508 / ATCC MYA-4615 / P0657) TaxID=510951 RepID=F8MB64_NEUT8|nr:uncharacterized protein NEUTE1DRAFT_119446 [Neurospora tetrasperma FGSC 2508]EGO60229.1 hypothetical protein NEUTE1DRAFT_119446 [Neurospora tetrasperma FGSC 2508]